MASASFTEILASGCEEMGLSLSEGQLGLFEAYKEEIKAWNKRINLTALKEDSRIAIEHFLDSLASLTLEPALGARLADMGAGAGLPGVPLKIARPDLEVVLIEATGKKASFLKEVVSALGLSGIEVVCARAEDAARDQRLRNSFDLATARALAVLPVLVEYARPLLRVGGKLVAYKGDVKADEVEEAEAAADILGGVVEGVTHPVIPFLKAKRSLVIVRKDKPTDPRYPRRPGIPVKRPLGT
ncbi:MAG: 16S rRNA (guanine(527)-N(7))-methyltransferase RsmG [Candidatus Aquicultorales bacterium]